MLIGGDSDGIDRVTAEIGGNSYVIDGISGEIFQFVEVYVSLMIK